MTRARRILRWVGFGVGILLALVVLVSAFVLFSEPGARLALGFANRSDVPVRARSIEGTLAGRFELHGVEVRVGRLSASIDTVRVAWRPLALRKHRVDITDATIAGARVVVGPAAPDSVRQEKSASADSTRERWVVTADRARVRNATLDAPGDVHLVDVDLVGSGGPDGYRAEITASGAAWRVPELRAFVRAAGNTRAVTVDSLDVRLLDGTLAGNAFVRWSPGLSWRGRLRGDSLQVGELSDTPRDWLGAVAFRAQTTGTLREDSTRIGIDLASLDGVLRGRALSAGGRIDVDGTRIASPGAWVRWGRASVRFSGRMDEIADVTLDATVPSLAEILPRAQGSARLRGRVTGTSSKFDVDVETSGRGVRVERRSIPDFDATIDATLVARDYVPESADLRRAEIRVGRGKLEVRGGASWHDGIAWKVALAADNFETSTLTPARWNLYGPLSLRATTSGERRRHVRGTASIETLSGSIRGAALSGAGSVVVDGGEADFSDVHLTWGDAHAIADGHVGATLDLEFDVVAPDLARLDATLHGALSIQGKAHGARTRPVVTATVRADSLRTRGYAVDHLRASIDADLAFATPADVRVSALGASRGETRFDSVSVNIAGPRDRHHASVLLAAGDRRLTLSVTGAYADSAWSGWIEDVRLRHPVAGAWHSLGRASVAVSRSHVQLDSLTLASGSARLSAVADWRRGGAARVDLAAGPGKIVREGNAIEYSGRLSARADTTGIFARLDIDLGRDGALAKVDGEASMPHFVIGRDSLATQPLEGKIDLHCADIGPVLAVLAPDLRKSSGRLTAQISPKGTAGNFALVGRVALEKARFDLASGLHLRDTELLMVADGDGRVSLNGTATSGGGRVRVEATSARSAKGWIEGSVTAKGERFQLIDQPDAQVFVSPDVELRLEPHHAAVTGTVRVPFARIETAQVPASAAATSPDVVFVEDTLATKEATTMTAKVRVELGDSVSFTGFGLRARLAGSLDVDDERGRPTRATGEIQIVDGKYRAFGSELKIDPGRLVFGGGAIDNPGLDVRAYRGLSTQQVTVGSGDIVGVILRGTLRRPELSVFSNPAMSESEIMSYLVLGRPMSSGDQSALASAALLIGMQQGTQSRGRHRGTFRARRSVSRVRERGRRDRLRGGQVPLADTLRQLRDRSVREDQHLPRALLAGEAMDPASGKRRCQQHRYPVLVRAREVD